MQWSFKTQYKFSDLSSSRSTWVPVTILRGLKWHGNYFFLISLKLCKFDCEKIFYETIGLSISYQNGFLLRIFYKSPFVGRYGLSKILDSLFFMKSNFMPEIQSILDEVILRKYSDRDREKNIVLRNDIPSWSV